MNGMIIISETECITRWKTRKSEIGIEKHTDFAGYLLEVEQRYMAVRSRLNSMVSTATQTVRTHRLVSSSTQTLKNKKTTSVPCATQTDASVDVCSRFAQTDPEVNLDESDLISTSPTPCVETRVQCKKTKDIRVRLSRKFSLPHGVTVSPKTSKLLKMTVSASLRPVELFPSLDDPCREIIPRCLRFPLLPIDEDFEHDDWLIFDHVTAFSQYEAIPPLLDADLDKDKRQQFMGCPKFNIKELDPVLAVILEMGEIKQLLEEIELYSLTSPEVPHTIPSFNDSFQGVDLDGTKIEQPAKKSPEKKGRISLSLKRCEICGRTCKVARFDEHLKRHYIEWGKLRDDRANVKTVNCDECGEYFSCERYEEHRKVHEPEPEKEKEAEVDVEKVNSEEEKNPGYQSDSAKSNSSDDSMSEWLSQVSFNGYFHKRESSKRPLVDNKGSNRARVCGRTDEAAQKDAQFQAPVYRRWERYFKDRSGVAKRKNSVEKRPATERGTSKKGVYGCRLCDKVCYSAHSFSAHQRCHRDQPKAMRRSRMEPESFSVDVDGGCSPVSNRFPELATGELLKCLDCGKKYCSEIGLSVHMSRVHNIALDISSLAKPSSRTVSPDITQIGNAIDSTTENTADLENTLDCAPEEPIDTAHEVAIDITPVPFDAETSTDVEAAILPPFNSFTNDHGYNRQPGSRPAEPRPKPKKCVVSYSSANVKPDLKAASSSVSSVYFVKRNLASSSNDGTEISVKRFCPDSRSCELDPQTGEMVPVRNHVPSIFDDLDVGKTCESTKKNGSVSVRRLQDGGNPVSFPQSLITKQEGFVSVRQVEICQNSFSLPPSLSTVQDGGASVKKIENVQNSGTVQNMPPFLITKQSILEDLSDFKSNELVPATTAELVDVISVSSEDEVEVTSSGSVPNCDEVALEVTVESKSSIISVNTKKCKKCQQQFMFAPDIRKHSSVCGLPSCVEVIKIFVCTSCGQTFDSSLVAGEHQLQGCKNGAALRSS